MGYLGATLTQVSTRAGETDVSLRDVTIDQMGNGVTECEWRERAKDFGNFEESELSWVPGSEEDGWLSLARGGLGQVSHEMVCVCVVCVFAGGWADE